RKRASAIITPTATTWWYSASASAPPPTRRARKQEGPHSFRGEPQATVGRGRLRLPAKPHWYATVAILGTITNTSFPPPGMGRGSTQRRFGPWPFLWLPLSVVPTLASRRSSTGWPAARSPSLMPRRG